MSDKRAQHPGNDRDAGYERKVNRGVAWVGAASGIVGALDWIANIIILLLISPAEYGIGALAFTLFPVLDLATDLGLSASVIQKDDHSSTKISTVFWLNTAMSLCLAAGLYWGAGPLLARLHGHAVLAVLLGSYGLKLVWQNVYFIPYALMRRELRFRELSQIRVVANIAEFVAKVGAAALGAGVYCFIIGPLCRVFITGIGVQWRHPFIPSMQFNFRQARGWALFGVKASAHRILFHLYSNVDYQVVNTYFGEVATAYYTLAYKILLDPFKVLMEVMVQVAFPAFSRLKNQPERLRESFLSLGRMGAVLMLGFLALVVASAPSLVDSFWPRFSTPPDESIAPVYLAVRILALVGVLRTMSFIFPPLLDGLGRPGISLLYTICASVFVPGSLLLFAENFGESQGYLSVAYGWTLAYPVAFLVLMILGLRQLEMPLARYLRSFGLLPVWAGFALASGLGIATVVDTLPAGIALVLEATVVATVYLLCLRFFEGLRPADIAKQLRDEAS